MAESTATDTPTDDAKGHFAKAVEEAKAGAQALGKEAQERADLYKEKLTSTGGEWTTTAKERATGLCNDGKSKASEALSGLGKLVSDNAQLLDDRIGAKYGDYARTAAQSLFEAWLDWQENGRLDGLMAWLRAVQLHDLQPASTTAKIERSLKDAMAATLVDDPVVLAAWLADAPGDHLAAREFLAAWPRLPASALWSVFINAVAVVAGKLGWPSPPDRA